MQISFHGAAREVTGSMHLLEVNNQRILLDCGLYQGRRDVLLDGLHRIGWEAQTPKAGMFVWAKVPDKWLQRMNTLDFAMMLLEHGDVAVSPGTGFGPAGEGFLRMALVENESRLRQAVRQIARCLERMELQYTPSSSGTVVG